MTILTTYDVSAGWNEIVDVAFNNGFYNIIETSGGQRQLPNTCLLHSGQDNSQVYDNFLAIVDQASANIGKPISVRKLYCVPVADTAIIRSDQP